MLLLGKLSLSGKLVLYLDATGQMIRLPGSPYSDKILHSKLSIQPRDTMITGQDIPYGNKIYSAFLIAEYISSRNTARDYMEFLESICKNCRIASGIDPIPLLVNTDCAGQLQNGILYAF